MLILDQVVPKWLRMILEAFLEQSVLEVSYDNLTVLPQCC